MKYLIIFNFIFLFLNGYSQSISNFVYLENNTKFTQYFSYFDEFLELKSITLKSNSQLKVDFKGELLLRDANSKKNRKQYLFLKSDTIIFQQDTLFSKNYKEDLDIINKINRFYPELNFHHSQNFEFTNFIKNNSFETIDTLLKYNYDDKIKYIDSLLIDCVYKEAIKKNFHFHFLNNYLELLLLKGFTAEELRNKTNLIFKDFNNESCINSSSYLKALYQLTQVFNIIANDNDLYFIELVNNNLAGLSKDFVLFYKVKSSVNSSIAQFKYQYKKITPYIVSELYKNYLKNIYTTNSNSEVDQLIEMESMTIVSLDSVLRKFKGKYVVLVFSASWCSPCIDAFPYIFEIERKLKDVVFIYLSIDKDINQWKFCVEQNNLPISQSYFLVNGINSFFAKKHQISSIPRYLVYDKDGVLKNANATSPKDTDFEKYLKELKQ